MRVPIPGKAHSVVEGTLNSMVGNRAVLGSPGPSDTVPGPGEPRSEHARPAVVSLSQEATKAARCTILLNHRAGAAQSSAGLEQMQRWMDEIGLDADLVS